MGPSQTLALKLWIAFVWHSFPEGRFLIVNLYKMAFMLPLMLVKWRGIFLNNLKAPRIEMVVFVLIPLGMSENEKKNKKTKKQEQQLVFLFYICQTYLSIIQNGFTDSIEKDQNMAGCGPVSGHLPALPWILHAPGIWQNWQRIKHMLIWTQNLLKVPTHVVL